MQQSILEAYPNAAVQVAIVWADRYPGDDAEAASDAATRLGAGDPRVVHWVEAEDRPVGKAVSAALGWPTDHDEAAWDIYLFWPPGTAWGAALPAPDHVFFQLGGRADEPGFARGEDLAARLKETAGKIAAQAVAPAQPR